MFFFQFGEASSTWSVVVDVATLALGVFSLAGLWISLRYTSRQIAQQEAHHTSAERERRRERIASNYVAWAVGMGRYSIEKRRAYKAKKECADRGNPPDLAEQRDRLHEKAREIMLSLFTTATAIALDEPRDISEEIHGITTSMSEWDGVDKSAGLMFANQATKKLAKKVGELQPKAVAGG